MRNVDLSFLNYLFHYSRAYGPLDFPFTEGGVLSILPFDPSLPLPAPKGLTCSIQNRYSGSNRPRVYALSWESLPHRRIQYLPPSRLPHQCLCRPSRSQPYHRHDSPWYYDIQNPLRKSIGQRRRSLLFWVPPSIRSSGCRLTPRVAFGATATASNVLSRTPGTDNCRRIRAWKYG
jgi:hypothetical protein